MRPTRREQRERVLKLMGKPKPSKYRNRKTECDGYLFDSRREALCYGGLKLREKMGEIEHLTLQRSWLLEVNGQRICIYKSDFDFIERGRLVVADTKGVRTPVYALKKKLMKAIHGIEIREL